MKNFSKKLLLSVLLLSFAQINFLSAGTVIIPKKEVSVIKEGSNKNKKKSEIIDKTVKPAVKFEVFTNDKNIDASMFDLSKNMLPECQAFLKYADVIPMEVQVKNSSGQGIVVYPNEILKNGLSIPQNKAASQLTNALRLSQFSAYVSNTLFGLTVLGLTSSTIYFHSLLESLIYNGIALPTDVIKYILQTPYLGPSFIAASSIAGAYTVFKYLGSPIALQIHFLEKLSGAKYKASKFFASTKYLDPVREIKNGLSVENENTHPIDFNTENDGNKESFLTFISQKIYKDIKAGRVQPQLKFDFAEETESE